MCLAEQVSRPGESLSLPYVARLGACLSNDDRVPDTGTDWPGSPTSISEVLHSQSLLGSPACNACQGLSCPIRPQSLGPLLQLVRPAPDRPGRPSVHRSSPVQSRQQNVQVPTQHHASVPSLIPNFQSRLHVPQTPDIRPGPRNFSCCFDPSFVLDSKPPGPRSLPQL